MTVIHTSVLESNPFVSVVIPSYNRADSIGQTIDSILNQQCSFAFEIIIGDDFSTDNVREVLKEYQNNYPEKIKLIFHEENIGLGANWASAVKMCSGKYIANCDNDDYWHNTQKLQLQVEYMENHPECGVCHTYHRNYIKSKNTFVAHDYNYNYKIQEPLFKAIFGLRGFECCNSSILYRREVIDKYIRLDDYILRKFTLQDWNTWVVLAYYTKFYCLPVCTTTITIDNSSITRDINYDSLIKRLDREEDTYKYVCSIFPNDFNYSKQDYRIYKLKILLSASIKNFDYKRAKLFANELFELGLESKKVKIVRMNIIIFLFYSFILKLKNEIKILRN